MYRSIRIPPLLLIAGALALAFGLWVFIPRAVTYYDFDPDEVARLETEMWQAYYDKDYPRLTLKLWECVRSQFGGSPWTGFQIALHASEAARVFQASKSRQGAREALPALQNLYQLLQVQTGRNFDPDEAARLELEWWQIRREHATDEEVTMVLARLYALLNDSSIEAMHEAARLRVEAMALRDARGSRITQEDWDALEQMLRQSYRYIKENANLKPG